MPSPRTLRFTTDALGLLFTLATGILTICAWTVAGQNEIIMSAYGDQYIAALAGTWFAVAYYISSLAVTAAKPRSRFTSLLSATIWRAFLVIAGAAVMGYYSTLFPGVRRCHDYRQTFKTSPGPVANCQLPLAAGIVGWITVVVLAASLVIEIVALRRFPNAWRAPLATVESGEDKASLNPRTKA